MTDAQVSQVAAEVIRKNLSVDAQVSQVAVEVLRPNPALRSLVLTATGGALSISGGQASFLRGRIMPLGAGAFAINASAANLTRTQKPASDAGAVTIDVKAAALVYRLANKLDAEAGSFSIFGKSSTAGRSITLTAETGAAQIFGGLADMSRAIRLSVDPGSVQINGVSALLYRTRPGVAEFGIVHIAGKDSALLYGRRLVADSGSFVWGGVSASGQRSISMPAAGGSMAISGNAAGFARPARALTAGAGAIAINASRKAYLYKTSPTVGPFYFAWADADESFGPQCRVADEHVFKFEITHEEGQIPTAMIEIRNPQIGLLNTSRRQWAWLSWDDGTALRPLFYGRLVGVPSDMLGQVVQLQFVARAHDYLARKKALGQSLKQGPFYDPLFIDPASQDDPDAILEGYSASWHIDRTTLDWTISDIIVPEDGVKVFDPRDVFYDSVKVHVGEAPLKSVNVASSVSWKDTVGGGQFVGTWNILTYYGDSLIQDWPQPGASLGGGWVADQSWCIDTFGVGYERVINYRNETRNGATTHVEGDIMSASSSTDRLENFYGYKKRISRVETQHIGYAPDDGSASSNACEVWALCYGISCGLSVRYEGARAFTETIGFTLNANVQPILFDQDADQEAEILNITANDPVVTGVSYWASSDGQASLCYLLMRARARLMTRARSIDVSFQTTLKNGIDLSCRKGAQVSDPRLPGGVASGKVISYTLSGDGDTGEFLTDVTIGCSVGAGGTVVTSPGVETYADNYATGYTIRTGVVATPYGVNDVTYTPITNPQIDATVSGISAVMTGVDQIRGEGIPVLYLTLPDVSSRDWATDYQVSTGTLVVPKQIDLSAANVP